MNQVLPNTNAPAFSALIELSMMTFANMKKTERQWRELLEEVGLRIASIEPPVASNLSRDGIIVAVWVSKSSSE